MITRIGRIWRAHKVLSLAFLAAILLTLLFGVRMVVFAVYWMDPAHRDQTLEGWMTPRYVAQSYELPPEVTALAIGVPYPPQNRGQTLADIAENQGVTLTELQARIEAAARTHRGQ